MIDKILIMLQELGGGREQASGRTETSMANGCWEENEIRGDAGPWW